jgi:hypothetical protein
MNLHPYLECNLAMEDCESRKFLDLLIVRSKDELEIDIYRKPTTIDTTIHFMSDHLIEQKLVAYRFFVNWMQRILLTPQRKLQELSTIIQIAQNYGYAISIITQLNTEIKNKLLTTNSDRTNHDPRTRGLCSRITFPQWEKLVIYLRTLILR